MRQAAGLRARLVLQVVGTIGATAHDFSGRGEPEPLLGAAVGLHLRHVAASLVPGVLTARVLSRPPTMGVRRARLRSPGGWACSSAPGLCSARALLGRPRPGRRNRACLAGLAGRRAPRTGPWGGGARPPARAAPGAGRCGPAPPPPGPARV